MLDGEALTAPTFPLHIGIAEAKRLIEPLLYEVHLGAVDVSQAVAVDQDSNSLIFKDDILGSDFVGVVDPAAIALGD